MLRLFNWRRDPFVLILPQADIDMRYVAWMWWVRNNRPESFAVIANVRWLGELGPLHEH